ncbi:MAG: FMN-binding protein, partial [Clostridia bacterium]|nr:FMN-binding protein [Clostridia bacterium]
MNNTIVKLGIRLFLFCMIAAVALAITNEVTKGPIAAHALASKMAALNTVMPGCEYEEADLGELKEGSELDELFVAKDSSGNVAGYALTASPQGYGGEIPITFGVSSEGYVTQVYVGSLQETAGLGSKVGEAEFKEQFIGIAADKDTLSNDVSTISGATISSSAFMRAASDALEYTEDVLGVVPQAGDKEAILAAFNAANGGDEGGEEAEVTTTAYTFPVKGFDAFNVNIEIDSNGKIASVSIPEHNETAGFGADLIADTAVFEALVGQDAATAQIEVRSGATLTSNAINEALSMAAAELAGGAKEYAVTGFGPFTVAIELDDAGKIVSVTVPSHGETPGLGADLIEDTAVFEALVGQDIASASIDVRAGVTLTSNAINDALAQAAKEFGGDTAPVIPGDPYTVKGMNKFTMYVELDGENIVSVTVPEHNETPGLGADLLTEEALSKLAGVSIKDAKIDIVSGVTLTSNAINNALSMAAMANGFEVAAPAAEPAVEEPAPVEETKDEPAETETAEAPAEETKEEPAETEKAAAPVAAETKTFEVTGFQPFKVDVAVDADGKIASVTIPENGETPGFGADLIADTAVFEALVGKSLEDAQIEVRSGATLTSNAINDALKQAASAFGGAADPAPAEETKEEAADPAPAKAGQSGTYEVTGMNPFKVKVDLDAEGKIIAVEVLEHTETPGLGAELIDNKSVFEALVGQEIAKAAIDVKTGVTLTSNAINDALKQAAAEIA